MGLLDTSCGRCTLASGFGGQLFPWGLSSSGFPCSLLGTSHCFVERELNELEVNLKIRMISEDVSEFYLKIDRQKLNYVIFAVILLVSNQSNLIGQS